MGLPWSILSSLPTSLLNHGMLDFNGRIYLVGGQNGDSTAFDPGTGKVFSSGGGVNWYLEGLLPQTIQDAGYVVFQGRMWVLGGYYGSLGDYQRTVFSSADGRVWRQEPDLPFKLGGMAVYDYNGTLFIAGGFDTEAGTNSKHVCVMIENNEWLDLGEVLPYGVSYAASPFYRFQMWLIGGSVDGGDTEQVLASADGSTWQTFAPWPYQFDGAKAVVVNDEMWVAGGWAAELGGPNPRVYRGDGFAWTRDEDMPLPAAYGAIMARRSILFACGGYNGLHIENTSPADVGSVCSTLDRTPLPDGMTLVRFARPVDLERRDPDHIVFRSGRSEPLGYQQLPTRYFTGETAAFPSLQAADLVSRGDASLV